MYTQALVGEVITIGTVLIGILVSAMADFMLVLADGIVHGGDQVSTVLTGAAAIMAAVGDMPDGAMEDIGVMAVTVMATAMADITHTTVITTTITDTHTIAADADIILPD